MKLLQVRKDKLSLDMRLESFLFRFMNGITHLISLLICGVQPTLCYSTTIKTSQYLIT